MLATLAATPAGAAETPAHITWQPCTDAIFVGKQCGTTTVPVDWSRPRGPRLTLAMVRQPALDQTHRMGTLLVDNGVGRSAIEQFRYALDGLTQIGGAMAQRFDLVAVDPRGVGHSTPVHCAEPVKPAGTSYFPAGPRAFAALTAHNRTLGLDCLRGNGPILAHMDMTNVARDLDTVRVGLGEKQLNWFGIQYSDLLAKTYARLYPGRLRTTVLDTAVDDTVSPTTWAVREAGAAEQAFDRFAAWCTTSSDCVLKGHKVTVEYDALIARANRTPIPAGSAPALTGEDIQKTTQSLLAVKSAGWPLLAVAITKAQAGDAGMFAGTGDRTELDTVQERAQACADTPRAIRSYGEFTALRRRLTAISPHLGGTVSSAIALAGCIGWPIAPSPVPAGRPVRGTGPALIEQSTHQSFAPLSAGYALARQLQGSVVLRHEGDDYSMFAISACVRNATNRYLTTLALPAPGTVCTD
jgi:pimeloyl-ACP methyl ester carboxylesterase